MTVIYLIILISYKVTKKNHQDMIVILVNIIIVLMDGAVL